MDSSSHYLGSFIPDIIHLMPNTNFTLKVKLFCFETKYKAHTYRKLQDGCRICYWCRVKVLLLCVGRKRISTTLFSEHVSLYINSLIINLTPKWDGDY